MSLKRSTPLSFYAKLLIILCLGLISVGCRRGRTPQQDSQLFFQQGLKYIEQGNISEAIDKFRYVIRLDSNFAKAYYHLGVAYQHIGDTEEALKYLNRHLEFEPEHLDTHLRIMRVFYLTGRIGEAIEKGNYILTKLADQAEVHALLGDIYLYKKKDMDAAVFHFKQVLKQESDSVEARMKLAKISILNGDQKRAQKLLVQVITLDPSNVRAYHWLADIYTQTQEDNELIELYKKIIKLRPKELPPRINLAKLYLKRQMYEEAKAAANEILRRDYNEATANFILGRIYLLQGDYQQAAEQLSIANRAQHKPDETLLYLGTAYQGLRQWEEAIEIYEKLVFIRPELFETQLGLAKLYLRTKQWDKAAHKANDLVYRFYGFEEAYLLRGLAHMQTGEWIAAQNDLQDFFSPDKKLDQETRDMYLRLYPNLVAPQRFKKPNPWYNTLGHYLLGICQLNKSKLNTALTEFDQAIAQHPAYVDPSFAKAITYHLQGRLKQAMKTCFTIQEVIGDYPLTHLILANIYTSQGDLVAAWKHMQQAEGSVAEYSFSQMDITKNVSEKASLSLAQLNLGAFYLLYGWKEAAKSRCQLVLAANPHNPLANYIVDEIYKLTNKYYAQHNRLDDVLDKLLEYP